MGIASEFRSDAWRKSSFCASGECVEVAAHDGKVFVRSSKQPDKSVCYTPDEWLAFTAGCKAGEFDDIGGLPAYAGRREAKRSRRVLRELARQILVDAEAEPSESEQPNSDASSRASSFLPEARLEKPPDNHYDLADREMSRATSSLQALNLQVLYDRHKSRMEWGATMRRLVLSGGLLVLGVAIVALLTVAGFSVRVTAEISVTGSFMASGGYGLFLLLERLLGPRSSQGDGDRPHGHPGG
jgi:Domain of unknown function (DUF397)